MASYVGLIRVQADGRYRLHIPDLPEIAVEGADSVESISLARQALAEMVQTYLAEKKKLKRPRSLASIMANPEYAGAMPVSLAI